MKDQPKKLKRAIAYICAEDPAEVVRGDFERQLATIEAYCAANGYRLVKVYKDVSADEPKYRDEYRRMIKYAGDNREKIDLVIVETCSRISKHPDRMYDFEHFFVEHLKIPIVYTILFPEYMRVDVPVCARWIALN